jgi:hypothetical protein
MKKLITIFFLCGIVSGQTTRMYFSNSTPVFTINANAKWFRLPSGYPNIIWQLSQGYVISTVNTLASSYGDSTTFTRPNYMEIMQYVTFPLLAQNLSGKAVHIQIKTYNTTGSGTAITFGIVFIRLVNGNGSIAREIDSVDAFAQFANATQTNNYINYTFGSVSVSNGQMIDFDFGGRFDRAVTNNVGRYVRYYQLGAGDLPVDATNTGTLNGWIEFTPNLKFQFQTDHFF